MSVSAKVRNRLIAVGALVVAAAGLIYISTAKLGDNLVYYWNPGEVLKQGENAHQGVIRLGGVVKPGTVEWNAEHTLLKFQVADDMKPEAAALTVVSTQVPPQMFREGIGVVVEGTYERSKTFSANRLMVNHSNEYRAPKPGDKPGSYSETVVPSPTMTSTP